MHVKEAQNGARGDCVGGNETHRLAEPAISAVLLGRKAKGMTAILVCEPRQ